jgi:hypothetical protein
MVSFFCQRGENISQRTSRNSGHDRKSERRKIDFTRNNNCVFKKLNDGNTIYLPPKIKRFTLFFLAYYFYCEKKPFSPVTVGFVGGLITSADSAFIGFHEDRLGGTNPATIDWSQIPWSLLKTSLRWIGFDWDRLCPGNSRFFNLDWIITV